MLYLFLSASAYTNQLSSIDNRVEQLQEELNELKLERGNSVKSVFDKFDADESNSLSMSEFKSMVTAGAVSLATDEERGGWRDGWPGGCDGCTCGSNGKFTCDCRDSGLPNYGPVSPCTGSELEACLQAGVGSANYEAYEAYKAGAISYDAMKACGKETFRIRKRGLEKDGKDCCTNCMEIGTNNRYDCSKTCDESWKYGKAPICDTCYASCMEFGSQDKYWCSKRCS